LSILRAFLIDPDEEKKLKNIQHGSSKGLTRRANPTSVVSSELSLPNRIVVILLVLGE